MLGLIFLYVLIGLAVLFFLVTYCCFRMTFFVTPSQRRPKSEYDMPPGKIYVPFYPKLKAWMKEVRSLDYREVSTTSFDGLTLYGKYYECSKGAPMELMFHGYRGNAERDLCGAVQRCFALGRNALIVDQRGAGKSQGNIISFGINESRDCLSWIDYINNNFPSNTKIILTGISMGASTVCIAAGKKLPENVVGVLADCGFSSAKEIIKVVIRKMHLPANLLYPIIKLSARIFGHFDLEETSAKESLKNCKIPVLFIHGDSDNFVPAYMSQTNFDATASAKRVIFVKDAGHGASYLVDEQKYLTYLADFFSENGIETKITEEI